MAIFFEGTPQRWTRCSLKAGVTTTMPSALGGNYAPDDHNHAHTPLLVLGLREGKPAVIAVE